MSLENETQEEHEQYMEELNEIQEALFEHVYPFLNHIDEQYEEHSSWFTVFIDSIHVLLNQGWTKENLLQEINDHHEIFLKNEISDVIH